MPRSPTDPDKSLSQTTVREEFIKAAMQSMAPLFAGAKEGDYAPIAKKAIAMADAVLAELSKTTP